MNELIFFGACIASVVYLGVGYFFGYKVAAAELDRAASGIAKLGERAANQLEQHLRMISDVDRDLQLGSPDAPISQRQIQEALDKLRTSNEKLQVDLESARKELDTLQSRRAKVSRTHARTGGKVTDPEQCESGQTTALLQSSHGGNDPNVAAVQVEPPPLFSELFDSEQMVAPYDSGVIPAPHEFQSVECLEITLDCFSFRLSEPPRFRSLILMVDEPLRRTYRSGRVSHVSKFNRYGKNELQVTCQFTGRLHHSLFE